jgi:hypothetical protein
LLFQWMLHVLLLLQLLGLLDHSLVLMRTMPFSVIILRRLNMTSLPDLQIARWLKRGSIFIAFV